MLAMMIAGVMLTGFPDDAMAARSGGRVGGRAFSSASRSAPRSAARAYAGGGGGGRTIINNGPRVIIGGPMYSPFGFGAFGGGYGMYGFGPFGYGYNPALSVGLTIAEVAIRES
jgi:hypothetical protein